MPAYSRPLAPSICTCAIQRRIGSLGKKELRGDLKRGPDAAPVSTATIRYFNELTLAVEANIFAFQASAHINGTFFNAGSDNPSDDVGEPLALGRDSSDPPGQLNVFGQINQGNNYFFYLGLGTVTIGTPIAATLTWVPPNHQFLVC